MKRSIILVSIISIFTITTISQARNILLNSSFEIWLDSMGVRMPFAWYTSEVNDSGSATRTTDCHSGLYAIKLTGSDTSAYAMTISISIPGSYYYFSGWCKTQSFTAGAFIITWLKLSQQPATSPTIIPVYYSNTYRNYTLFLQAPDSAVFVNVTIATLPYITIYVDDVTLSDTSLTGIEEQSELKQNKLIEINISPNPCQNSTTITCKIPEPTRASLCLYDINGRLIRILKQTAKNLIIEPLDTKDLKSGIYFIQLKTPQKTIIKKFIIQK
ncbi:MAG: T9SS type A sorting domain-containing protein [candidate division WOR-3 bacterium]